MKDIKLEKDVNIMSKKLVMTYETDENKKSTLTLEDPKDSIQELEVKDFMDYAIAQNIQDLKTGNLVAINKAEIVETVVQRLI